jgi:pimeloyl-ACP methyl ester carboxylesterase
MVLPPSSDRPTVVLLHSSASSSRQWADLVEMLRHDFRVLTPDLHGHGMRPDWPHERRISLADEAALAIPLLEEVGGACVVGHSYGGAVALKLACMHPRLVHGIVAFEPVLFRMLADDTARPEYFQQVQRGATAIQERIDAGQLAHAARHFIDFWSGPGAWQSLPAKQQQAIELRMPAVISQFHALFAEPFAREQLARMSTPMLFLSGSRTTPVGLRLAQMLRAALPLADHEELPGLGHMGPVTHPGVVNERIRQFLRPYPHIHHRKTS